MVDKHGLKIDVGDCVFLSERGNGPLVTIGKIVKIVGDTAHIWVVGKTDDLLWKRLPQELRKKVL